MVPSCPIRASGSTGTRGTPRDSLARSGSPSCSGRSVGCSTAFAPERSVSSASARGTGGTCWGSSRRTRGARTSSAASSTWIQRWSQKDGGRSPRFPAPGSSSSARTPPSRAPSGGRSRPTSSWRAGSSATSRRRTYFGPSTTSPVSAPPELRSSGPGVASSPILPRGSGPGSVRRDSRRSSSSLFPGALRRWGTTGSSGQAVDRSGPAGCSRSCPPWTVRRRSPGAPAGRVEEAGRPRPVPTCRRDRAFRKTRSEGARS